jgi:glyoxylase-like metal-dependent hydrolase (beta-lactamase superfamily II)
MLPVLLWQPARPPPGAFEVLAFDVGQGSAVLVRTAGYSLLYDAGPRYSRESDAGHRVLVPALRAMGERPQDLVLSHSDSDHIGGARALLAAQPQISIKISCLGITDRAWTPETIRPIVLECIDIFGTERAMFASDFPVERVHGSFDAFYSAFDAITADFSADERDRLFAANVEAIYRI